MSYRTQPVPRSSRHSIAIDEYMELANIAITVALISTVLATSVSLAEPADKGIREASKERDLNEETERRIGIRKDREKLEAEQGACGAD